MYLSKTKNIQAISCITYIAIDRKEVVRIG